ncbi:hypothetical protein [Curtobacterium sp. UNCCL17]|uniref:hypothetical protein n=1 Tax=Curtobacterium sp. UNCCL17 TaxID=1449051 RepID=UPI0012DCDE70|nr:hypothetical protein [Curtobacterium sp. UNCCL17]
MNSRLKYCTVQTGTPPRIYPDGQSLPRGSSTHVIDTNLSFTLRFTFGELLTFVEGAVRISLRCASLPKGDSDRRKRREANEDVDAKVPPVGSGIRRERVASKYVHFALLPPRRGSALPVVGLSFERLFGES